MPEAHIHRLQHLIWNFLFPIFISYSDERCNVQFSKKDEKINALKGVKCGTFHTTADASKSGWLIFSRYCRQCPQSTSIGCAVALILNFFPIFISYSDDRCNVQFSKKDEKINALKGVKCGTFHITVTLVRVAG